MPAGRGAAKGEGADGADDAADTDAADAAPPAAGGGGKRGNKGGSGHSDAAAVAAAASAAAAAAKGEGGKRVLPEKARRELAKHLRAVTSQSARQCEKALQANGDDIQRAADWLLSQSEAAAAKGGTAANGAPEPDSP